MQAAVDCNGSGNGKSGVVGSTTTTATVTVTVLAESRDELLSLDATPTTSTTLLLGAMPTPTSAALVGAELRHRLHAGKAAGAATATTTHPRNGVVNAHKNGNNAHRTEAATSYAGGSNVEPAKRAKDSGVVAALGKATVTAAAAADNNNITLNASSNSGSDSCNSLTSSTSSSVIASAPVPPTTRHTDTNNGLSSSSAVDRLQKVTHADRTELAAGNALPVSSTPTMAPSIIASSSPPPASSSSTTSPPATAPSLSATLPPAPSPATNATGSRGVGGSGAAATTSAPELLQWKDMPQYLQFNPYVIQGYRPLQTFKGCLFSLFYWHNETINILTHAIPIVYILAIVPGLMPWDNGYRFLCFCHVIGSVAPWCGSFVYHLFMNIDKGENVYYRLLKLDMVGIWVSQSFGAMPLVTATTFCFTFKWKWFIIISYSLLSLWGLYKALTASSPWQRRLCFALPFTMRSFLTLLRTIGLVGGNRVALSHVYLQDGVSILGGAIGAMRIPEKWFPGVVDFYLNSHNIMHVLVVVAVYSMHQATIKDFEWMSATICEASTNATGEAIESTISANIEL